MIANVTLTKICRRENCHCSLSSLNSKQNFAVRIINETENTRIINDKIIDTGKKYVSTLDT